MTGLEGYLCDCSSETRRCTSDKPGFECHLKSSKFYQSGVAEMGRREFGTAPNVLVFTSNVMGVARNLRLNGKQVVLGISEVNGAEFDY